MADILNTSLPWVVSLLPLVGFLCRMMAKYTSNEDLKKSLGVLESMAEGAVKTTELQCPRALPEVKKENAMLIVGEGFLEKGIKIFKRHKLDFQKLASQFIETKYFDLKKGVGNGNT